MNSTNDTTMLPLPKKNALIGFCKFNLCDMSRHERFNMDLHRQFEVMVWYPGETVNGGRKSYAGENLLRSFMLENLIVRKNGNKDELKNVRTNSFVDVPVSENRSHYPVLIFSHDMGMHPEYYSMLMEHLASEGYFIFSVNHPEISESCQRDVDGGRKEVRMNKRLALQSAWLSHRARVKVVGKTHHEKWETCKQLLHRWQVLDAASEEMTKDHEFLVSFLEQISIRSNVKGMPYELFAKRLDLKNIAMIGHGWGGAAAVRTSIRCRQIKATVNLDGFNFGLTFYNAISKPLLTIYSEKYSGINDAIYFCSSENETFTIPSSNHNSFSDWSFLPGAKKEDSLAVYQSLNLLVSFFDRHLKKIDYSVYVPKKEMVPMTEIDHL